MEEVERQKEYLRSFIDSLSVDLVYPESILQGYQYGRIFVDHKENPKSCLFWHQSGFGYITGACEESFLKDVLKMILEPEHPMKRLALQVGEGEPQYVNSFFRKQTGIVEKEQYLFQYRKQGIKEQLLPDGFQIEPINQNNYELLNGNIIPAFSWRTKEEFLQNGFGYCISCHGEFAATAFSAGISDHDVDIGVETAANFRGKGLGKAVALEMINEIGSRNKTAVWECNTLNTASQMTAESVGFEIRGKHSLWTKM